MSKVNTNVMIRSTSLQRTALIAAFMVIGLVSRAQLTVTRETDLEALAAAITGPGVTILNPEINCGDSAYGEFSYTGTQLGINDGVLLTTGWVDDAEGPNGYGGGQRYNSGTSGDAILNTVTGRTTYNRCRFEFDIIPTGDSLRFNFVFASEEYNEWVGSQYNDVFGFFISGPGIPGDPGIGNDKNIALVPGTSQAVTINNVNNGSNSAYYFDNTGGQDIQYDGFTQGLFAESRVTPCQTYHLKLIVADASDRWWDSGVFIERIRSNQVTMTSHTLNGSADMVEGCNPGWVTFTRPSPRPTPLNLTYYLQGTATNGTDYSPIGNVNPNVPKTVTIPANQTSVNVNVNPIADALSEPTESLLFILGNPLCPAQNLDSLIFDINDTLIATLSPLVARICRGDSIQLQVTGGSSYSWTPAFSLSSSTIANPWAKPNNTTNYSVVVTDGTCSRTITRQVRVSNTQITGVVTRPLCNGQSNGAINLSLTGGVPPYAITWTGPGGYTSTSEDLVNIPAGTYTVTVSDVIGCARTQSFNVGSPEVLAGTLTPSIQPFGENIACNGGNTGTLSLALTGGTAPYTINWTGPTGFTSINQNLTGLRAGQYNVNVSDANGCTFTSAFTMTEPTPVSASIVETVDVLCFGLNEGEAMVEATGGLLPYTYSWNTTPVQTTANAVGLAAGNYTVLVTDGYGCTKSVAATITGPAAPLGTTASSPTPVSCFGGTNGAATVTGTGGTSPYSYVWNTTPAQTTATATGLSAGSWTCTVTDDNGCTTTRNVTITQPAAALSASIGAQTNVNCFGASTGNATIAAIGGTAPYTYAWNTTPVQSGATANNLPAGTWTCTVTDARGCTTAQVVTITQPAAALSSSISAQTNVNCFGGSTGSATVAATGGTGPYSFSWNTIPVQGSATATNLTAGNWQCTITDARGCTTTREVLITQPAAALSSSITAQTNVNCFGGNTGSATISATGGTTPYGFSWNTTPVQTTASATGLPAGTWTCTVTDANGCSTIRNVTITQPAAALTTSIGAQTNVNCFGGSTGSATVLASGGTSPYSFNWNTTPVQTAASANGLTAGTWTCTVTDARGCSTDQNVTITQPAASLSAQLIGQTDVNCFGETTGNATIAVSGGTSPYTYNWNTTPAQNSAVATNLGAGTWTCTVTDARGCTTTRSATITQPAAAISASTSTLTPVSCSGGNNGSASVVVVGGTGPYTYSWNTAPTQTSATANNLTAGTWTCTITDVNECTKVHTVTISEPAAPLATSISAQTNVSCFGGNTGSATISASAGTAPYGYVWNTTPTQTGPTASNLGAGTWTCTVTDANGCTTARNVTITQPLAALSSAVSAQTNVNCFGGNTGSATLAITGGTAPYSYSWNTTPAQTSSTATGLAAGVWTCTVTDARGCTISPAVSITQPAAGLSASISAQTNVNCFGGTTGSATVSASGGTATYSYSWNTSPVQTSPSANNLAAGAWTCTVTDARGCTTTSTVTITQPAAALSTSISAQTNVNCFGGSTGSATINVTGGTGPYSYSWNTLPTQSGPSATGLPAGSWTCTVTDALGCSTSRSVTITQPAAALAVSLSAQTNVTCFGGLTGSASISVVGGTAPYTYSWNTTPVQTTATASNIGAGNWTCTVTDARGCTASQIVLITQPAASLSTSISAQTNVGCSGQATGSATIAAIGGTAPYTFNWNTSPPQTAANAINLTAGNWTCTVTDLNGCTSIRTVTITQPTAALDLTAIIVPATCGGAANGSVDATITGGTTPYAVSWTGPNGFVSSNVDISGLESGVYVLSVVDANGCSATSSFNVGQPGLFTISGTTSDFNGFEVSCPGATDGSISQNVSGGTSPYAHSWSGPNGFTASTEGISGLPAGTYTYTLTDNNGCSTSATYTLDAPAPLSANLNSPSSNGGWNIACNGSSTGSIDGTISGGVAPVNVQWNGPSGYTASAVDITGLSAGTYTLTITDANGCSLITPITLTEAPVLTGTAAMTSSVSCVGANDGAALATANGGTAPYVYAWNTTPPQSDPSAEQLPAGTWTCTISDANGCSIQRAVTITQPAAPLSVTITASTDVLCFGAAEGSATALANGGTAPYTIVWNTSPAQTTATATALEAGSYTVTATDARGCTADANVTIEQPASEVDAFVDQVSHVTCFGADDGAATITVTGGSGSYTITWNTTPPVSGPTATGLAPGLYLVAVADNNGCTHIKNYPVTIQGATAPLALSFDVDQVTCNGAANGAIDLTITGGGAPYSHIWTAPDAQQTGLEDIDGLVPGNYALQVVDFFGCTLNTTIAITEPATLAVTGTITTAACQGSSTGAVNSSVSGGTLPYAFAWSGPNGFIATTEDISSLAAGVYGLTVTDGNGCIITESFNVSQPGSLSVTATLSSFNGSGVSCAGATDGGIDLDVTGGTSPFTYTWSGPNSFSASTQDIAGLASGTYTVTVADDNGCSISLTRTISTPAPLTATVSLSVFGGFNISCAGATDGSINLSVSGGTSPYAFAWTGPNGFTATSEDLSGLAPGTYALVVTDANGCSTTAQGTVTEPQPLDATLTTSIAANGDAITCHGNASGSISANITGGNQPWSIQWSGPSGYSATTDVINDLIAGTYTAIITDANGCSISRQMTLTQPDPLAATGVVSTFNGSGISCADAADGSIDLTVTGGAGGYVFVWNGANGFGATTEDVTSLEPGNYSVQITDMNGCMTSADFLLEAPDPITATLTPSDLNGSNVSCSGASDGSIDLTIAGGTAPYTVAWNGPNGSTFSSEDLTGLAAGSYTATITDANGCTFTASRTLTAPAALDLALQTSLYGGGNQVSCAGGADGTIDLTITGGTAPYTIAWTDGIGFNSNSEDLAGMNPGFYAATVTDANGCSQQINTTLSAPTPVDISATLSNINGSNVTCNGATDGSIDLSITGGIPPYTIVWDDGTTDEDRNGITAGTYSVQITDANGCVANASYTLTAPASVLVDVSANILPNGMNITCAGGNDASLEAELAGGTMPYTIAWTGPAGFTANTTTINGLIAGTYDLVVTDANGCTNSSSHVVTEPDPVTVDLASITYNGGFNIPCATISIGVFNATAAGGTPTYTYAWSGPDGFTSNAEDLTSLVAGQYDVVVTDINGCTGSASATLTAPDPLDVVIAFTDFDGYPVSCIGNDGGVQLTVSGGAPAYQFDWIGPNGFGSQSEDITGLEAGTYDLVVTDANGCRNDTTITLQEPAPIQATFVNSANICGDASIGTIDMSITGGGAPYDVLWSGPNGFSSTDEDLVDLMNGTYTVNISDGLGCTGAFTTLLNGPAPIASGSYVSFYGAFNLQCQGDSSGVLNLAPIGGTAPFNVTVSGPGGFFSSSTTNTGLVAGDYAINIVDANGCTLDTTITLTEPLNGVDAELTVSVYPSGTNVSCYGASDGSIDATISGGTGPYVVSWRGPDGIEFQTEDVSGLPAGFYNYELVVTDANQCSFATTVTLTQPDTALYLTTSTTVYNGFGTTCNGSSDGAIDLAMAGGNGGYMLSWSGPNGFSSTDEDLSGLGDGIYTATVTDMNGCVATEVVDIIAPDPITSTLNTSTFPSGTPISCATATDGSIEIVTTGGAQPFNYAWSGPNGFTSTAPMINGLGAGTYCVQVTDANGCVAQSCTTLNAPVTLSANAAATSAACSSGNGSVDLTVSGGSAPFQFNWDNGANTEDLSDLSPGTFLVVVTDINGCTVTAQATVSGSPAVGATATTTDNNCHGDASAAIDLTVSSGTAPFSFAWNNGATSEDLTGIAGGSYSVTITDAAGCRFTANYALLEPTAIAFDTLLSSHAEGYNVSAYGAEDGSITTAVSGGTAPYTFSWSNGADTESISGLPAGVYTLEVTDANGCSAILTVELTQPTDLEMPNAFSPNGDRDNERFVIRGIEGYPSNMLTVLNRWGNVVFEQPNYKNQWGGENSQGDQLPNGTYFVILSINDGTRTLQGFVDLRR